MNLSTNCIMVSTYILDIKMSYIFFKDGIKMESILFVLLLKNHLIINIFFVCLIKVGWNV